MESYLGSCYVFCIWKKRNGVIVNMDSVDCFVMVQDVKFLVWSWLRFCQEHATIHSYSGTTISLHVWRIYNRKVRKEGHIVIWAEYVYD